MHKTLKRHKNMCLVSKRICDSVPCLWKLVMDVKMSIYFILFFKRQNTLCCFPLNMEFKWVGNIFHSVFKLRFLTVSFNFCFSPHWLRLANSVIWQHNHGYLLSLIFLCSIFHVIISLFLLYSFLYIFLVSADATARSVLCLWLFLLHPLSPYFPMHHSSCFSFSFISR